MNTHSRPVQTALLCLLLAACSSVSEPAEADVRAPATLAAEPPPAGQGVAIFAGGCFWCMEQPFESLDGVLSVTSGYTGGNVRAPSYEDVSAGRTGHAEAVRIVFDPARITYARLLEVYWHNIDPTQGDGQFCDHGNQYRSAIFVASEAQRAEALRSRDGIAATLSRPIVTQVVDATDFWIAEDYHQDYYRTHPVRYRTYRSACGRDARLESLWGPGSH